MIISFSSSDLIIDSLSFLELVPSDLECQTKSNDHYGNPIWEDCSKHEICSGSPHDKYVRNSNGEAVYRKPEHDYYSLNNWVESMDIECKDRFEIGIIGAAGFLGMTIGSVLGTFLSVRFGRKYIYIGGLFTTTATMFVLTFDAGYNSVIIALFFYGIGVFSRMTIGYVYALELVPQHGTMTLGMLLFSGEWVVIIFSNLYLVCGGRDALIFVYVWLAFSLVPFLFSLFLPESPMYLHSVGDYEGAKKNVEKIAWYNLQNDVHFDNSYLQKEYSTITPNKKVKGKWCGLIELYNDKETFVNTIAMAYLWSFYTFGHHSLLFMMKYFPGNKYVNGLFIAFAITIAPIITRVLQSFLSSKQIYYVFSILSILASLLHEIAFDKESIGALIMVLFVAVWVDSIGYTNYYVEYEYFNPRIATLAYGICSTIGRGSSIFAPIVVEEFQEHQILIFLFLSIIWLFSTVFIQKPHDGEVRYVDSDKFVERNSNEPSGRQSKNSQNKHDFTFIKKS